MHALVGHFRLPLPLEFFTAVRFSRSSDANLSSAPWCGSGPKYRLEGAPPPHPYTLGPHPPRQPGLPPSEASQKEPGGWGGGWGGKGWKGSSRQAGATNACDSDSGCGLACDATARDSKSLAMRVERCEPLSSQVYGALKGTNLRGRPSLKRKSSQNI